MAAEFKLPDVGEGIVEGELIKWRINAGDSIKEDQIVAELETDKAIVEIPSPLAGVVIELCCKEGSIVKVGDVLLTIGDAEHAGAQKPEKDKGTVVGVLEEAEEPENREIQPAVLSTPAVRKMAKDAGIDINSVQGTGPQGRVTAEDIKTYTEENLGVKRDQDVYGAIIKVPLRGIRKNIAKNMPAQQHNTAHVTHMDEADVTELAGFKEKEKVMLKKKGIKLTHLPFIVKAVAASLKTNSWLNASLNEETGEIILKKYYNIGISVNSRDGLIVPVIKNADQKNIIKLAEEIRSMAEAARSRSIDLKDLKGGTFTITNIGSYGGIFSTPVINYPEAAILATGRIREKPVVKDGKIVIRKLLPLSLTFDHRIMDGATVTDFTRDLKMHLEDPGLLLLELR